nr:hypothetical protein CFP56_13687 [Quercus suber]
MDAIKVKANSEGIKAKDVYGSTSSGKVWNKRCRENLIKENGDLEALLREEMNSKLAKHEEKFAQKLQSMGTLQQSNIEPATMLLGLPEQLMVAVIRNFRPPVAESATYGPYNENHLPGPPLSNMVSIETHMDTLALPPPPLFNLNTAALLWLD